MTIHAPIVTRTQGGCSTCNRGHGKGARPVVLIKMEAPPLTADQTKAAIKKGMRILTGLWYGLCLECAALVAKEIGR